MNMGIENVINDRDLILTEAAIVESLRRSANVDLHPKLVHALLIYDKQGRAVLAELYQSYIHIAHKADVPILIGAPTWRANSERLADSCVTEDVNDDAVSFLNNLRSSYEDWAGNIFVGGCCGTGSEHLEYIVQIIQRQE